MPTYDYECEACQHSFEEFQPMTAAPLRKCPKCGKPNLRRLFGTGAAVLFKGSGFYETDYRSESYKAAAKADQEAATTGSNGKASANGTANGPAPESKGSKAKACAKSSKSET